jgi:transposase
MAMVDRSGLPLAIDLEAASPHESTLLEGLLQQSFLRRAQDRPRLLIGDKAYDSDPLDARLARKGVTLIAPHRCNRKNFTQDRRSLRRYKRRWKVERFFAWIFNSRKLVTRYEHLACNFLGFLHLACAMLLLRRL